MKQTKQQIIDEASRLIQTRGYHAFSYQDISKKVGIKTASIHYYFPTKSDLVVAVVGHHTTLMQQNLNDFVQNNSMKIKEKITSLCSSILTATYLSEEKMCLGGMLAIDVLTLEAPVQRAVCGLLQVIDGALVQLLQEGIAKQEFRADLNVKAEATALLAAIEGTLLLARLFKDDKKFTDVMEVIIERLI